ncbi:MAG: shikimate dehydrogenase [Armatimonadetes bacterium]|nr:MAG: shikimate dehydrogenase [Armatimonadota bacterium]
MTPFAFVIHPIDARRDVARKYPIARYLPEPVIEWFLKRKSAQVLSEIKGIRSATGAETKGWFIGCPLTPKMMLELPLDFVYDKILECCELAADLGAKIIGLGAFTAVVGDGGETIAKRSPIPVTTGNSYTVATAMDGAMEAAKLLGIQPSQAVLAVVGATGSIGRTCAILMAPSFAKTILVGRDYERTAAVASEASKAGGNVEATTDIERIREADVIVTVTSAGGALIEPHMLKSGSVICDVARPRDVSLRVAQERKDVLVIEGGVVEVPGEVDFGFNFGFPPKTAYACMSETMLLALENRPEPFTVGKTVSPDQVREIEQLAQKHGFHLAGFRSFEKPVSEETIREVLRHVKRSESLTARVEAAPEA